MKKYFLNKTAQENGEYELHAANCRALPAEDELLYLGFFRTFSIALAESKKIYADVAEKVVACPNCSTIGD